MKFISSNHRVTFFFFYFKPLLKSLFIFKKLLFSLVRLLQFVSPGNRVSAGKMEVIWQRGRPRCLRGVTTVLTNSNFSFPFHNEDLVPELPTEPEHTTSFIRLRTVWSFYLLKTAYLHTLHLPLRFVHHSRTGLQDNLLKLWGRTLGNVSQKKTKYILTLDIFRMARTSSTVH